MDSDMTASPCIGICRLDGVGKLCTGCGRTLAEIAVWPTASEAERRAIVARARERLAAAAKG